MLQFCCSVLCNVALCLVALMWLFCTVPGNYRVFLDSDHGNTFRIMQFWYLMFRCAFYIHYLSPKPTGVEEQRDQKGDKDGGCVGTLLRVNAALGSVSVWTDTSSFGFSSSCLGKGNLMLASVMYLRHSILVCTGAPGTIECKLNYVVLGQKVWVDNPHPPPPANCATLGPHSRSSPPQPTTNKRPVVNITDVWWGSENKRSKEQNVSNKRSL